MSSSKGIFNYIFLFVQRNKSSSWDDIEVELSVIVCTVVGDGVEELGEGNNCILGEGAVLCLNEG